MGSSPEPAVPAYRRLRMARKRPQVLRVDLNRSASAKAPAALPAIRRFPSGFAQRPLARTSSAFDSYAPSDRSDAVNKLSTTTSNLVQVIGGFQIREGTDPTVTRLVALGAGSSGGAPPCTSS
jgi:hypothetical protein